jgi:hypothetical protein
MGFEFFSFSLAGFILLLTAAEAWVSAAEAKVKDRETSARKMEDSVTELKHRVGKWNTNVILRMWWTDRAEQDLQDAKQELQYAKQELRELQNKKFERSFGLRPITHPVRIANYISVVGIGRNLTTRNAITDTTFGKLVTGRNRLWILTYRGLISWWMGCTRLELLTCSRL